MLGALGKDGKASRQVGKQASKQTMLKKRETRGWVVVADAVGPTPWVAQRASTRSAVPSGRCAVNVYHSTEYVQFDAASYVPD